MVLCSLRGFIIFLGSTQEELQLGTGHYLWPRGDLKLHRKSPSHGAWLVHLVLGQGLITEQEEPPFCGASVLYSEQKVTIWPEK